MLFVLLAKNDTPVFSVHYAPKHRNFVNNLLSRAIMRVAFFCYEEFQDFSLNCAKSKKKKTNFETFTALLNRGCGVFSVKRETAVVILKGNFGCWVGCWAARSPVSPAELHLWPPALCGPNSLPVFGGWPKTTTPGVFPRVIWPKLSCISIRYLSNSGWAPQRIFSLIKRFYFWTLNFLSSCSINSQLVILPPCWGF